MGGRGLFSPIIIKQLRMPERMTFSDYIGFSSMTLLVIGAMNWGTVAIRYAANALPNATHVLDAINVSSTGHEIYKAAPTPDLINALGAGADVQMFVYWGVFVSGIIYMGLFVWNSIEVRDA